MNSSNERHSAERSPLLHALTNTYGRLDREWCRIQSRSRHDSFYSSSSSLDGGRSSRAYPSIHPSPSLLLSNGDAVDGGNQNAISLPVRYAEKAFSLLLRSLLFYVFCCIIGILLIFLTIRTSKLESAVNWWLVFTPFWIANVVLLTAHILSVYNMRKLKQFAYLEQSRFCEPLLPLLRRLVVIFAITFPCSLLILWSEIAFCAQFQKIVASNMYMCYTPLLIIQAAVFLRYFICSSRSSLPSVFWLLFFLFTILFACQMKAELSRFDGLPLPAVLYQTSYRYPLPWWLVLAPLAALEGLMGLCLSRILYDELIGVYRMLRWQLAASALYIIFLVSVLCGQILLIMQDHTKDSSDVLTFPIGCVVIGLACGLSAAYIVAKKQVEVLLRTGGGAVPIPLTRTNKGWTTEFSDVENWLMFGDIKLTDYGILMRKRARLMQEISWNHSSTAMVSRRCIFDWESLRRCFVKVSRQQNGGRTRLALNRHRSGSYSDFPIEMVTSR